MSYSLHINALVHDLNLQFSLEDLRNLHYLLGVVFIVYSDD